MQLGGRDTKERVLGKEVTSNGWGIDYISENKITTISSSGYSCVIKCEPLLVLADAAPVDKWREYFVFCSI